MLEADSVVAAIPAFNEEQSLGDLIDQVLEQEYADVYVLNDASEDNTLEVALSYGKDVKVIAGEKNVGSGANRNRLIPKLSKRAIIHFIDADVTLNSDRNPERARELVNRSNLGFIGGMIRHVDGSQITWNYGPAFSLPQIVSALIYDQTDRLGRAWPALGNAVRPVIDHWELMAQWPNTLQEPAARDVFWACEGNMIIPSDVFARFDGYDPKLRYHEVMELAMRMEKAGLSRRFEPSIDVTHQNRPAFNNANPKEFWTAQAQIIGKMGLKKFLFPPHA